MLTYPSIDPIIISLGPVSVHWYGMMYLLGFAAAWWLGMQRAKSVDSPVKKNQVEDMIFYGAMGAIIGGRVGYALFYGWDMLQANPLWIFKIWEGGMSFHGGLLGAGIAMWLFSRKIQQPLLKVWDFLAPLAPIGLGLGRIGNFIGQELWGRPTDGPWGMIFPNDPLQLARHPSQLYQAFLEGLVLFCIIWIFSRKPRPTGAVTGLFLLCYGSFRFLVEFVRQPDQQIGFEWFGWVTRGQQLSLPMVIGGALLLGFAYYQQQKNLIKTP